MIDMTTEYQHMINQGQSTHQRYLRDAEIYRQLSSSQANKRVESIRFLERIGRRLIEVGRRLCERRGVVVVDVAFHRTNDRGNGHAA